jgi:hypothetical protein
MMMTAGHPEALRQDEQIATLVPPAPPRSACKSIQLDEVFVDERDRLHSRPRFSGGL